MADPGAMGGHGASSHDFAGGGGGLLFSLGKLLIGLYIGRSSVASVYGAAGSLVVLLVWVYYSAQIVFFGAEFTQVRARRSGRQIEPSAHAEAVPERQRQQEGLPPRKHGGAARA